jgi:hypothetical protein
MIKNLAGGVVVVADVLLGMHAPEAFRNLHHDSRQHVYEVIALYTVLFLLTLWVIVSMARTVSGAGQKQPARPAGYTPRNVL